MGRTNLDLRSVNAARLAAADDVPRETGLLTNDATTVALMRRHGLSDVATNDDDFDAVPGLTVWKPR